MERIIMAVLTAALGLLVGCLATIVYLNKRFVSVRELLTDKILINDLLKKEISVLKTKKNSTRNYRRRKSPAKQQKN
jgi:hypothetical protein|tara:strand:+ start:40 stop:270 length:231 start_codon:yes stop_codon:yes gene_type:complete